MVRSRARIRGMYYGAARPSLRNSLLLSGTVDAPGACMGEQSPPGTVVWHCVIALTPSSSSPTTINASSKGMITFSGQTRKRGLCQQNGHLPCRILQSRSLALRGDPAFVSLRAPGLFLLFFLGDFLSIHSLWSFLRK